MYLYSLIHTILITLHYATSFDSQHQTNPGNHEAGGWYYGHQHLCNNFTYRHSVTSIEAERQELLPHSLDALLAAYQHCGVTVINRLLTESHVDSIREQFMQILHPYLESRRRIRNQLQQQRFIHPDDVFTDPQLRIYEEPYLHAHQWLIERNDGRIDVTISERMLDQQLDHQTWYDSFMQQMSGSSILMQLLRHLLGTQLELKSIQMVVALPSSEGCTDQHWHRDDSLLFDADTPDKFPGGAFQLVHPYPGTPMQQHETDGTTGSLPIDVHMRGNGVHLPPYALNVFVPLVDLSVLNGPTEFTLGSHMWGSVWAADEEAEANFTGGRLRDEMMSNVSRGSAYIADYRTVHRGTINKSMQPRPVLMLIYGRRWWKDSTNYEPVVATKLPTAFSEQISASHSSVCIDADDEVTDGARPGPDSCQSQYLHSVPMYEKAYTVYRNLVRKWRSSL